MSSGAGERVWLFGDVVFDGGEGILTVAGKAVEIDRNCRALLAILLEQAGAEVSKEHLLQAGWPNRIVHENSLAKAIGRLRQALGEHGQALETVYGHGYRLNVELVQPPPPEQPSDLPAVPASVGERGDAVAVDSRDRRGPLVILVCGAILVAALVAVAVTLGRPVAESPVPFREGPPVIADAPDAVGRLLWVDDHPQNNIYEAKFFQNHKIAVHNVTGSADALRLLAMYDYDVVISDMGRGEDRLAGLKLAGEMRARGDDTPLIIYTVRPDGEAAQNAQREMVAEAGAQGVVVTPQEVRQAILKLFDRTAARSSS